MDFTYMQEFQQTMLPGTRAWVSGFRLSGNVTRVIRDMPPTLVECCVGGRDMAGEMGRRHPGAKAYYVAPVGPDGVPCLDRMTGPSDLHFFRDEAQATDAYLADLKTVERTIGRAKAKLDKLVTRVESTAAAYGTGPDSPSVE